MSVNIITNIRNVMSVRDQFKNVDNFDAFIKDTTIDQILEADDREFLDGGMDMGDHFEEYDPIGSVVLFDNNEDFIKCLKEKELEVPEECKTGDYCHKWTAEYINDVETHIAGLWLYGDAGHGIFVGVIKE